MAVAPSVAVPETLSHRCPGTATDTGREGDGTGTACAGKDFTPLPRFPRMRRPEALLLFALLLLAGCTTSASDVVPAELPTADPDVAVVARSAPATSTNGSAPVSADSPAGALPLPARVPFAPPVALPMVDGIGGGEPNIAALPDGTLFVTAPSGLQMSPNAASGAAYLWRSRDNGTTWETLREPIAGPMGLGAFCSCDSDVVTSPDGWVYFSDWWNGGYLVEASPDGGDTWTSMPIATREGLVLVNVDRQWLVAGDDGVVGLFYSHFSRIEPGLPLPVNDLDSGVHAVFSTDHGQTWGEPVIVKSGGDWQIAHPRMMPDGAIVMPYGLTDASESYWRDPSMVMLALSKDGGATWEHLPVAEAPEGFDNLWAVQADVDATGAIHVGWSARVDDDIMATYVATSRDLGQTWTEPLALRAEGLNFLPWVATFGESTVAVGWYGGNATGDPTEADDEWFAYVAESTDGGESFVVHRVSDAPVKVGSLCPRGAACGGDRELLDYVSMVYDATGAMHYAFARSQDGVAVTLVANEVVETLA